MQKMGFENLEQAFAIYQKIVFLGKSVGVENMAPRRFTGAIKILQKQQNIGDILQKGADTFGLSSFFHAMYALEHDPIYQELKNLLEDDRCLEKLAFLEAYKKLANKEHITNIDKEVPFANEYSLVHLTRADDLAKASGMDGSVISRFLPIVKNEALYNLAFQILHDDKIREIFKLHTDFSIDRLNSVLEKMTEGTIVLDDIKKLTADYISRSSAQEILDDKISAYGTPHDDDDAIVVLGAFLRNREAEGFVKHFSLLLNKDFSVNELMIIKNIYAEHQENALAFFGAFQTMGIIDAHNPDLKKFARILDERKEELNNILNDQDISVGEKLQAQRNFYVPLDEQCATLLAHNAVVKNFDHAQIKSLFDLYAETDKLHLITSRDDAGIVVFFAKKKAYSLIVKDTQEFFQQNNMCDQLILLDHLTGFFEKASNPGYYFFSMKQHILNIITHEEKLKIIGDLDEEIRKNMPIEDLVFLTDAIEKNNKFDKDLFAKLFLLRRKFSTTDIINIMAYPDVARAIYTLESLRKNINPNSSATDAVSSFLSHRISEEDVASVVHFIENNMGSMQEECTTLFINSLLRIGANDILAKKQFIDHSAFYTDEDVIQFLQKNPNTIDELLSLADDGFLRDTTITYFLAKNIEKIMAVDRPRRPEFINLYLQMTNSPFEEMRRVRDDLIDQLLVLDNPQEAYKKVESVFLPTIFHVLEKILRFFPFSIRQKDWRRIYDLKSI